MRKGKGGGQAGRQQRGGGQNLALPHTVPRRVLHIPTAQPNAADQRPTFPRPPISTVTKHEPDFHWRLCAPYPTIFLISFK